MSHRCIFGRVKGENVMRKGVLFASALLAGTVAMTIPVFASVGSWQRNGIGWWFEYSDGSYVQSSWIDINNTWYYMGASGYMQTGWLNYGGGWYYLDSVNGNMRVGWISLNNVWYYLNPSNGGRMDADTYTPDGYYVDSTGAYQPNTDYTNSSYKRNNNSGNNSNTYTYTYNYSDNSATSNNNSNNSGFDWSKLYSDEKPKQISTDEYEDKVIELVNAERTKRGIPALKKDDSLMDTAHLRANELAELFSHDRPDGSDCFSAFPSGYNHWGENIAEGQKDPAAVMDSWMHSEGHKKNILNKNFDSIGVGCYNNNGTLEWVQNFGRKSEY